MALCESALLTDLYQLSMLQVYWKRALDREAVFEFFVRELPPERGFLIAAGLEQLLFYLEHLHFSAEECDWLARIERFESGFLDYLMGLRFTGDVDAMPEGTIFFAEEPIVQVTAPLPEAQLIETRLINILQFQSLVASKAARVVLAADGRHIADFGLRRAHGAEAGMLAARASYLAGFDGSSNVLAWREFGVPTYGTMAHSFIEAHDSERVAFQNFARVHKGPIILLLDTYDTEAAAQKVIQLTAELAEEGITLAGVRLDSGDLAKEAKTVRKIFDEAGLTTLRIFASGGLDEYEIQRLLSKRAPIDGFGVGTRLVTSADAPYFDCAYKLVEYDSQPRFKLSKGKELWPGRKQVCRHLAHDRFASDVVCLAHEKELGIPLLQPAMRQGKRLKPSEPLGAIRDRVASELQKLPPPLHALKTKPPYPVTISDGLKRLAKTLSH